MAKMIRNDEEKIEKAYLVYFEGEDSEHELKEMQELIRSAMLEFAGANCVKIRDINPATYIGEGKVEEIAEEVKKLNIDVVVFDLSLSGSQLRNLANALDVKVIDRTMLILEIFAHRAQSSEGKLQVKLAELKYSLTRLSCLELNNSRSSQGLAGRGVGETQKELNKRKIQDEITKLEREVKDIQKQRQTTRKQRLSRMNSVALIGYTNAGKSTLMNTIAKAGTYADDKLFATLDVLSKKVWDNGVQYVLIDTVGFVSNLPHELMYAFSATLEETTDSNVLLIVVDASDKHKYEQISVVETELEKLKVNRDNIILVYNKIDKISQEEINELKKYPYETCYICAKSGKNVDKLKELIRNKLS